MSPSLSDKDSILPLTATASSYECPIAPPTTFLRLTPILSATPSARKASIASEASSASESSSAPQSPTLSSTTAALMTAHSRSSSSASAASSSPIRRFLKLGPVHGGEVYSGGESDWSEVVVAAD